MPPSQSSEASAHPSALYTPTEITKLAEFRPKVANLDLTPENLEDAHLIRWLRARNLNIEKAYEMLSKSLEWRKENNVDGLLEREDIPPEMKAKTPFAMCGLDKSGCPILICPIGGQDIRQLLDMYGPELTFRYQIIFFEKMMEMLRNASKEVGRPVSQIVQIVDIEGYNFRQIIMVKECRDLMAKVQSTLDNNYPEILRYCMVVNAPTIFHLFSKIFKPFMSKRTIEKMDIYGEDRDSWKKVVADRFPVELIPARWGGTRQGSDEFCSKEEIWVNGCVPLAYFNQKDPSLRSATINARDTLNIKLNVSKGESSIAWKFKLDTHDIGFQIVFEDGKVVVPLCRVRAEKEGSEGTHPCQDLGVYTFVFDNSYSVLRSKNIEYDVYVLEKTQ